MVTIDLSTPPPPAANFLDGLPRRVALTLPELQLVAARAGGAPLPFETHDGASDESPLAGRLGTTRRTREEEAYTAALESLHDPEESLQRRGLLDDPGLAGAVGLLATPRLALDIDVAVSGSQVKAWHRYADGAVATLSTCDGIVFEVAWLPVAHWTDELARVTAPPEDIAPKASAVPASVELPYALVDAVGEALRSGRADLVPVLLDHHEHRPHIDGEPLPEAEAAGVTAALHSEARGRLRILAAEVGATTTSEVGVVSWVLLADGWHSITPRQDGDVPWVSVRLVDPTQLASELAPVLARVGA